MNVLEPGEIAATAGTSGVVYGVSDTVRADPRSRVHSFAHVNHSGDETRLGILLCNQRSGELEPVAARYSVDELDEPNEL